MVFYVLVIAVLNLGLGFAVAVFFANRGREMVDAVDLGEIEREPKPSDSVAASDEIAGGETIAAEPESVERQQEPADVESADLSELQETSSETSVVQSPGEMSIRKLIETVERYNQDLSSVDSQIREEADIEDVQGIKAYFDSLQTVNADYLAAREEAHEAFEDLYNGQDEFAGVCGNLREVFEKQTVQIGETNRAIDELNAGEDAEESCRRVMTQTAKLLDTNHQVRDVVDDVALDIARSEHRIGSLEPANCTDQLTGLLNKAGVEKALQDRWTDDPHCTEPLCIAMIDVDHFAQVNERYGQRMGDRVLRAIAQLLVSENDGATAIARVSGQRFQLLYPDVGLRSASNVVERFRQLIEKVQLKTDDCEVPLTVSCAVNERTSDDTPDSLTERGCSTLREAKRYGRNCTFLFEGGYPAPVVPPNLSLPERTIDL